MINFESLQYVVIQQQLLTEELFSQLPMYVLLIVSFVIFFTLFFGFIFIKLLQNGIDLSRILNNPFQKSKRTPFKKVHKNYSKPLAKPSSRIVVKDKTQQQIDEILDKISQSGYDCLTQEEKEFLFKAGK